MPKTLTDEQLRRSALAVLERELGPVEALRFLALIRREPFDYQAWRDTQFGELSLEDLFRRMEEAEAPTN